MGCSMSVSSNNYNLKNDHRVYVVDTDEHVSEKSQKMVDDILNNELKTEQELENEKVKLLILGGVYF